MENYEKNLTKGISKFSQMLLIFSIFFFNSKMFLKYSKIFKNIPKISGNFLKIP